MDLRSAPAAPGPAPAGTVARRALIVDDEEVIRNAMRRFLARQGWAIDEAADGAAALPLLVGPAAAAYDAIVFDLQMPGITGMELYDRVVAARPALARRMIATTGDPFTDDATRFFGRTRCEVLSKPFGLAEMRELLTRVAEA